MVQYSRVTKNKEASKVDVRAEIAEFEKLLADLKINYEQFFLGILPMQPEKLHKEVKRRLRRLFTLPFKTAAMTYKVKVLENRYTTYNNYWQRILKQKEEGTYSRDVFKAQIRQKNIVESEKENSAQGKANKQMKELFSTYKDALEKTTGRRQNIDFNNFQRSLVKRAKALKEQQGASKFSFKVVVKKGKVSVCAQMKNQ